MPNKAEIIDFKKLKKHKLTEINKTNNSLEQSALYTEYLIDEEIDMLRSELGLNKKED